MGPGSIFLSYYFLTYSLTYDTFRHPNCIEGLYATSFEHIEKKAVRGGFLSLSPLFYQSLFLILSLLFIAACDSDEKEMKHKNEKIANLEKKIKGLTGNRLTSPHYIYQV